MKDLKAYRMVVFVVSMLFAILLFGAIRDEQGVLKSVSFVGLGVAVIWFFYYLVLGSVFRHFHEQGRKEKEEEDNADFV